MPNVVAAAVAQGAVEAAEAEAADQVEVSGQEANTPTTQALS